MQPTTKNQPKQPQIPLELHQLAEAVRQACIQAALDGYQDAGMSGLCHEGAWEMAIDAIRALNIVSIIQEVKSKE